MKYWLSYLPLEVWVDCYRYPWISREEMGRIVDRIGNRKFAEYLQFYLHDWGKHKLNEIRFDGSTQIIAFLRQIGPILSDVRLVFHAIPSMENLRVVLVNLLPLLNGTHSLCCNGDALPTVGQFYRNHNLDKLKQLTIFGLGGGGMDEAAVQETVNFLKNWLASPGKDSGGPRLCRAALSREYFENITQAIHEQFLSAESPSTFALLLQLDHLPLQFAEFHAQNSIGEELSYIAYRLEMNHSKSESLVTQQTKLRHTNAKMD